jgi:hypothetical protein
MENENDNLYTDKKLNYEEKRDRRINKYKKYAKNAKAKSEQHRKAANAAVDGIPFGQPILVGHHSEKHHRAAINKCRNHMDKTIEEQKKAAHYFEKAMAAENNSTISSDDPDAIQKLKEKIALLQKKQDYMKRANKEYKKLQTANTKGEKYKLQLSEEEKKKLLEDVTRNKKIGVFYNQPYPGYELTSVNTKINEAKKRIEKLEKFNTTYTEDKQYKVDGIPECTFEKCATENRFKIYPPKKERSFELKLPDLFKKFGFHWSGTNRCYQRQLSGLGHIEEMIIEALKNIKWGK